jgi:hypothetical protein
MKTPTVCLLKFDPPPSIPDLFVLFQDDENLCAERGNLQFALRHTKREVQNWKISICIVSSIVPQYSMENAVDFVVLKHRWRWKPVNENEDEEALHTSFLMENALRICRLIISEKNVTKILDFVDLVENEQNHQIMQNFAKVQYSSGTDSDGGCDNLFFFF